MKGLLKNTGIESGGWVVEYDNNIYQLYPHHASHLYELSKRFDNIEARIDADPIVEFEFFTVAKMSGHVTYAKLSMPEFNALVD